MMKEIVTIPTKLYSEYAEHLLHILTNSNFPNKEDYKLADPTLHRTELNFSNLSCLNMYATIEQAPDGELMFESVQWNFQYRFAHGKSTDHMRRELSNLVRAAAAKWADMDVIKGKAERSKVYDKNGVLLKESTVEIDICQFVKFTDAKKWTVDYQRDNTKKFRKEKAVEREKSALEAALAYFKENSTCLKELFAVADWLKDSTKRDVNFYGPEIYDKVIGTPKNVIEEAQCKLLESLKSEVLERFEALFTKLEKEEEDEILNVKKKYADLMLNAEKQKTAELESVERNFKVM